MSHTANLVQEWCKENMAGFWSKELWPPSSPDLNPIDFAIWSNLESKACSSNHSSVESSEGKIMHMFGQIITRNHTCLMQSSA